MVERCQRRKCEPRRSPAFSRGDRRALRRAAHRAGRHRVREDRVRDGIRHLVECQRVHVRDHAVLLERSIVGALRAGRAGVGTVGDRVEAVAGLVVARVERAPRRCRRRRGLLRRLVVLGAGEQAAGRDAGVDERRRSPSGRRRRSARGQPLRARSSPRRRPRSRRAGRARSAPKGRAVAVVDEADVVRRADHVEVEVQP